MDRVEWRVDDQEERPSNGRRFDPGDVVGTGKAEDSGSGARANQ